MGKMDSLLKSKFRGSLLGVLTGDCLGSAYEGDELFSAGMKLVIQKSFDKLQGPYFKAPVIQFTDDSAMTQAVAESLIEHTGFDQTDMAKKFVKSYYLEPNRGYGAGVTTVFHKLRNNKFVDVLGPAREQFNGEGSLGNGGAMRVAPIALFYYKNPELMVDTARKQSHITHTHKTGVDGAILQAIAIQQTLLLDPKEELDSCKFTDNLINEMDKIEIDEEGLGLVDPSPYKTQLKLLRDLLCEGGDGPHDQKVVHQLGNDVSALHSVPTAIYCFLRAQKPIPAIQTENPLRRTIQYADVICSMGWNIGPNDYERILKGLNLDNLRPPSAGDPRSEEHCLNSKIVRPDKSLYSLAEDQCLHTDWFPQSKEQTSGPSCSPISISRHRSAAVSLAEKSTGGSSVVEHRSPPPPMLRIHSARIKDSQLSDYCSENNASNRSKPGVQFSLSSDSLLAEKSSSTIVCETRADYTCNPEKKLTSCGVQWNSLESKQGSLLSDDAECKVREKTKNVAISARYDEHDVFANTIASQLREMDVETALQAQNHIKKVITDYRLHKPETQSIRLLRPEISDRGKCRKVSLPRDGKSCHVQQQRTKPRNPVIAGTGQQAQLQCSSREIEATAAPQSQFCQNNAMSTDSQRSKSKPKKSSLVIEPIITHYKRPASTSTPVKHTKTDKGISLGGDTDTIGSMAGAIAGAFYGEEMIRPEILKHCEASNKFRDLADQLFHLATA